NSVIFIETETMKKLLVSPSFRTAFGRGRIFRFLSRCLQARLIVDQAFFQLFFDFCQFFWLRFASNGMVPLECCLKLTARPPICITQMVINCWIFWPKFDCFFKLSDGLINAV